MPTFSTAEEPIFLVTDLSGRGGTYNANQSDLVNNPDEHEDDDEFWNGYLMPRSVTGTPNSMTALIPVYHEDHNRRPVFRRLQAY